MDEIGVVRQLNGPLATVVVEKKSACEQCTAGCKISGSEAEIEALNDARAQVGQKVRVVLRPYSYLKGSLLVYGAPALSLILGAVAGKEILSGFFPSQDPDILSALAGFGAFLVSFVFIKILSRRIEKNIEYKPVIAEIVE